MRRARVALAAALALSILAGPETGAQNRPSRPPAPAAEPEAPPPPYEPQLLALAEIMGSLAYLRDLCAAPDAQGWRERMAALLEAEGATPTRRAGLTSAYNRGFRAYSVTHRHCTPGGKEAAARLAVDGERLARALAGRYGG